MYKDPGATAMDNVDGNITSQLSTFGVGAVQTTAPTSQPFVVRYDVTDAAGNAAIEGVRYVVVACQSPEVTCSASDGSLYCSTTAGVCIDPAAALTSFIPSKSYPNITLVGQAVLGLTQDTSYLACPDPQPTDVICDR